MHKIQFLANTILFSTLYGIAFLLMFNDSYAQSTANEIYQPLLKFNTAESVKQCRFNMWGGNKQGKLVFVPSKSKKNTGCLQVEYQQSKGTLSCIGLKKIIAANIIGKPVSKIYIRYRVKSLTGLAQFQFLTESGGKKYSYTNTLGLNRKPEWQYVKLAFGGWNKQREKFNLDKLINFYIIFHGSGVVNISEIGVIYNLLPGKQTFNRPKNYLKVAQKQGNKVKIDGIIDIDEQKNAGKIKDLKPSIKFPPKNANNKTITFVKATKQGLYCAAKCFKSEMTKLKAEKKKNSVRVYNDESVEFHIAKNRGSKDFRKIAVNANSAIGGIHNSLDDSGIKASSKKYSDRWETEVLIPWALLDIAPKDVFSIAFNVSRNCYDSGALERMGWSTTIWNDIANFGVISFQKNNFNATSNKFSLAELRKIAPGSYLLISPQFDGANKCRISITDPSDKTVVLERKIKNRPVEIPIKYKDLQAGVYHIDLLVYDSSTALSFQEINISEQPYSSIKSLDINAIALFPVPKIFKVNKGCINLNNKIKVALMSKGIDYCGTKLISEMKKFYGLNCALSRDGSSADIIIGLSSNTTIKDLLNKHQISNDFEKIKYDGFAVNMKDGKVLIVANNKRGLLYGVNAFIDLVKMSSNDVGEAKVCNVRVIDWPRSEFRFFHHVLHSYFPLNKYQIGFYKKMLERFPMAFRFNGFMFELADYYKWKSAKLGHGYSWSPEEYANVIAFINQHYMPVMPSIQSHGHMKWWLFRGNRMKNLWEEGSNDVICTNNPESNKLLFNLYNEDIAMCSRNSEFKPRYFFTSLDEVRWNTTPQKPCHYCKNKPKNQIFLQHIKKLNTFIKKKGMKMMMCSDMIVEDHNGLNDFKCAEIAEDIPKDVILCNWSARDFPSIDKFSKQGFDNWKFYTAYNESRVGEKQTKGYVFNICTYHWWLSRNRCLTNSAYGLMAQALFLNNCWNSLPEDGSAVWLKNTRKYGNFLMRNWSRKPLLHAGTKIFTLDLSSIVNKAVAGANAWFDEGCEYDLSKVDFKVKEIAGIPVRFARNKHGVQCVVLDQGNKNEIKLNNKAASLILLHGAHLKKQYAKKFWNKKYYKDPLSGKPIVEYSVSYSDGTSESFNINYGLNISEWRIEPLTKQGVFSKYLADSRYVWENKTPHSCKQRSGDDIALYQYEWVNPNPEKTIKTIKLKALDSYVSYALLAISAREPK